MINIKDNIDLLIDPMDNEQILHNIVSDYFKQLKDDCNKLDNFGNYGNNYNEQTMLNIMNKVKNYSKEENIGDYLSILRNIRNNILRVDKIFNSNCRLFQLSIEIIIDLKEEIKELNIIINLSQKYDEQKNKELYYEFNLIDLLD